MLADSSWNTLIASLPGAHFLQTEEWARVKAQTGWQPLYLVWLEADDNIQMVHWPSGDPLPGQISAAAMVLQRSIPVMGFAARLRILYCPKGPLLDWANSALRRTVLDDLAREARRQGVIFLKIDPDVPLGSGVPGSPEDRPDLTGQTLVTELASRGWTFSDEQVQYRNTVQVDLSPLEDTLLSRMKPKTRYNIRLAQRKGVSIRLAGEADLELLYRMYAETSLRDGFIIRSPQYYYRTWQTFLRAGKAEALIAEVTGNPVAAIIVFHFATTAWYVYGMSRDLHREWMPNHLLQWEAMRHLRVAGCQVYDLWGAPDKFIGSDPLWGVYRFKEGLGGQVVRHIGAWDLPLRPWLYRLYTQFLPRLLDLMRKRGENATRSSL